MQRLVLALSMFSLVSISATSSADESARLLPSSLEKIAATQFPTDSSWFMQSLADTKLERKSTQQTVRLFALHTLPKARRELLISKTPELKLTDNWKIAIGWRSMMYPTDPHSGVVATVGRPW